MRRPARRPKRVLATLPDRRWPHRTTLHGSPRNPAIAALVLRAGCLASLGPGDTVPEFEAALRKLADGEITATPVLTRHGWHVIRMDALATGAVLPFKTVKPRIAEALEKTEWARAAKAFVASLVASAEITGADLARRI